MLGVDAELTDLADIKTMCPLAWDDCKFGTWWSAVERRCVPCWSGLVGTVPQDGAGHDLERDSEAVACTVPQDNAGNDVGSVCPAGKYGRRGVSKEDYDDGKNFPPPVNGVVELQTEVCVVPPPGRYAPSMGLDLDTLSLCPRGKVGINASDPGFAIATNYETEANACPQQCPKGKWAFSGGLASVDECIPCLPGSFSTVGGLTSEDQCTGSCGPGRFSPHGEEECKNCSAGKWSTRDKISSDEQCGSALPEGTGRCPTGSFGEQSGLTSADSCSLCSAGRFSADVGRSSACAGVCPAGRHGNFQLGLTSANQCVLCFAGRFSGATAIKSPEQCSGSCAQGKYSITPGASSSSPCVDCKADFVALPGKSDCQECGAVRTFAACIALRRLFESLLTVQS